MVAWRCLRRLKSLFFFLFFLGGGGGWLVGLQVKRWLGLHVECVHCNYTKVGLAKGVESQHQPTISKVMFPVGFENATYGSEDHRSNHAHRIFALTTDKTPGPMHSARN